MGFFNGFSRRFEAGLGLPKKPESNVAFALREAGFLRLSVTPNGRGSQLAFSSSRAA
jgi:hypothetical protein